MQWYIVVGIFLQVFLKLRTENSVCFSSLTLAMVVIIALVLVTNMDLTVGQLQKTMYFTRFQGEREKKKVVDCTKPCDLAGYSDSTVQTQKPTAVAAQLHGRLASR